MNANQIIIVGRLSAKPVLKGFTNKDKKPGHRCFMRVAVTRLGDLGAKRDDQRTNYIPVVAWGPLGERCAQFLDVGTEVTVVGELIAESKPKLDGEGNHIEIDGVKQYNDYTNVQANSVQFGRKSAKNATTSDMQGQLAALQTRLDAMGSGEGQPAATPESDSADTPAPAGETGDNPFEEGDATATA